MNLKRMSVILSASVLGAMLLSGTARAADAEYELTIKDHRYSPTTLSVPSGKKFRLIVKNQDATPEEFESYDLNREKVVTGGSSITVFLGPLAARKYRFFGDFHRDTAQGVLEAS